MSYAIFQDWARNKSNIKGRLFMIAFRINHLANINKLIFLLLLPYMIIYRFIIEWLFGCELPYKTKIGAGFVIYHGLATVINDATIIGNNCTIRHCTTIGHKVLADGSKSASPIIGNNVDIGANVCIIGSVRVGNNVVIGAGAVVVKDVPDNCIAVGNPAKILNQNI